MHVSGLSRIIYAVSEAGTRTLKRTFEEEVEERTPRDNFQHCLINAAHQFLNKQGDEFYILAGYPWFKVIARDLFIALPGTTLSIKHRQDFERIMDTASAALIKLMDTGETDKTIEDLD